MTDIHKIFQEIEEKSKHGDYIYRGEPKCYENVSSRLWRKFAKYSEDCDVTEIQEELFLDVKRHVAVPSDQKMRALSEIQHYGGDTNLIDFTKNYLIALFFACEQQADEDGRVILQNRDKKPGLIVEPDIPQALARDFQHRIEVQKSVFVHKPEGFFIPEEYNVVTIFSHQKKDIMSYLQKYHNISISTVYNDLHGYIKYQDFHGGGYTQFHAGVASMSKRNYEMAVEHFTRALNKDFSLIYAHCHRGDAYHLLGQYDKAINDYSAASKLDPTGAWIYSRRAVAYAMKNEDDMALEDFDKSIELDAQHEEAYALRGTIHHKVKSDSEQALKDYNKSICLNPDKSSAYYLRAMLYYDMHEEENNPEYYSSAVKDFVKAVEIDPTFVRANMPEDMKKLVSNLPSLGGSLTNIAKK